MAGFITMYTSLTFQVCETSGEVMPLKACTNFQLQQTLLLIAFLFGQIAFQNPKLPSNTNNRTNHLCMVLVPVFNLVTKTGD